MHGKKTAVLQRDTLLQEMKKEPHVIENTSTLGKSHTLEHIS